MSTKMISIATIGVGVGMLAGGATALFRPLPDTQFRSAPQRAPVAVQAVAPPSGPDSLQRAAQSHTGTSGVIPSTAKENDPSLPLNLQQSTRKRVLVMGDSTADWLSYALSEVGSGEFDVTTWVSYGCGYLTPDRFVAKNTEDTRSMKCTDWYDHMLASKGQYDVLVIWNGAGIRFDTTSTRCGKGSITNDCIQEEIRNSNADLLSVWGGPVVWVNHPAYSAGFSDLADELDRAGRSIGLCRAARYCLDTARWFDQQTDQQSIRPDGQHFSSSQWGQGQAMERLAPSFIQYLRSVR